MLRNQLKKYNSEYNELEKQWMQQPSHLMAWATLKWCKKIRDMFDAPGTFGPDEVAVMEPMVCRVDVLGHYSEWSQHVCTWRKRFHTGKDV